MFCSFLLKHRLKIVADMEKQLEIRNSDNFNNFKHLNRELIVFVLLGAHSDRTEVLDMIG